MGRGDKKTAKGKRALGSYGNTRQKKKTGNSIMPKEEMTSKKEVKETTEKKTTAKKTTAKATAEKKPATKKTTTKKTTEAKPAKTKKEE